MKKIGKSNNHKSYFPSYFPIREIVIQKVKRHRWLSDATCKVHVRLIAPNYVTYNSTATLHCDHNVPDADLHKVEFMKGDKKILQYIKDREPPFKDWEVEGASMKVSFIQSTYDWSWLSSNYAVFEQLRSHTHRICYPEQTIIFELTNQLSFLLLLFSLIQQNIIDLRLCWYYIFTHITSTHSFYIISNTVNILCVVDMILPVTLNSWRFMCVSAQLFILSYFKRW